MEAEKISMVPWFKPAAAGWEARTLALCNAAPCLLVVKDCPVVCHQCRSRSFRLFHLIFWLDFATIIPYLPFAATFCIHRLDAFLQIASSEETLRIIFLRAFWSMGLSQPMSHHDPPTNGKNYWPIGLKMSDGIRDEEGLLKSVTEASIKATWPTKKLANFWKENSRITAKRLGSSLDCQFRKSPVCSPHCSVVFLIICEEWDSNLWRSHLLTKVTQHLYCILAPLCFS